MSQYRCGPIRTHHGVRDASTAVSYRAGTSLFLVASDEDRERTLLRLYDTGEDGGPIQEFEISNQFLAADSKDREIDLEGAARMGTRTYWIGSHSRSREGDYRSSRHRLFATELRKGVPVPVGRIYRTLVQDIGLDIDDPKRPKQGGLSIEGLCSTSEPAELLIGMRSPLIHGKAMLVPLRHADEVIEPGVEATFKTPILLDLNGLGVRSIDYWQERNCYLIIAGPAGKNTGEFRLYRWSGSLVEDLQFDFKGLGLGQGASPEGLLIDPSSETVFLFFDEGSRDAKGSYFRSLSIHGL